MDAFEFDCPHKVYDLREQSENILFNKENKLIEWFEILHPHEEILFNERISLSPIKNLIQPLKSNNSISQAIRQPVKSNMANDSIQMLQQQEQQQQPKKILVELNANDIFVNKGIKRDNSYCDDKSMEEKLKLFKESKKTNLGKNQTNDKLSIKRGKTELKPKVETKISKPNDKNCNTDIALALKLHNEKFKSVSLYEPPRLFQFNLVEKLLSFFIKVILYRLLSGTRLEKYGSGRKNQENAGLIFLQKKERTLTSILRMSKN